MSRRKREPLPEIVEEPKEQGAEASAEPEADAPTDEEADAQDSKAAAEAEEDAKTPGEQEVDTDVPAPSEVDTDVPAPPEVDTEVPEEPDRSTEQETPAEPDEHQEPLQASRKRRRGSDAIPDPAPLGKEEAAEKAKHNGRPEAKEDNGPSNLRDTSASSGEVRWPGAEIREVYGNTKTMRTFVYAQPEAKTQGALDKIKQQTPRAVLNLLNLARLDGCDVTRDPIGLVAVVRSPLSITITDARAGTRDKQRPYTVADIREAMKDKQKLYAFLDKLDGTEIYFMQSLAGSEYKQNAVFHVRDSTTSIFLCNDALTSSLFKRTAALSELSGPQGGKDGMSRVAFFNDRSQFGPPMMADTDYWAYFGVPIEPFSSVSAMEMARASSRYAAVSAKFRPKAR